MNQQIARAYSHQIELITEMKAHCGRDWVVESGFRYSGECSALQVDRHGACSWGASEIAAQTRYKVEFRCVLVVRAPGI
jgi:hypothetical protein